MNSRERNGGQKPTKRLRLDGRIKDVLLLAVLALVLVFAAWKIFAQEDSETVATATPLSETEEKISRLLEEIDGVGEASVMINETEDGVKSAVVVCEGANNLQVMMDIREAVAAALGTEEKSVKIYLKKE
ncbi:MAG: hypothetical protein IJ514_01835 [Clostridia bacterium]|nr:hypothetical protein [Clostridia bacterium]